MTEIQAKFETDNTVQAMCIAALHARNTREKTPHCTQFTRAIRESNRKIHAVSLEVRVKFSRKDCIQAH